MLGRMETEDSWIKLSLQACTTGQRKKLPTDMVRVQGDEGLGGKTKSSFSLGMLDKHSEKTLIIFS